MLGLVISDETNLPNLPPRATHRPLLSSSGMMLTTRHRHVIPCSAWLQPYGTPPRPRGIPFPTCRHSSWLPCIQVTFTVRPEGSPGTLWSVFSDMRVPSAVRGHVRADEYHAPRARTGHTSLGLALGLGDSDRRHSLWQWRPAHPHAMRPRSGPTTTDTRRHTYESILRAIIHCPRLNELNPRLPSVPAKPGQPRCTVHCSVYRSAFRLGADHGTRDSSSVNDWLGRSAVLCSI
jgi:hypothetical protein